METHTRTAGPSHLHVVPESVDEVIIGIQQVLFLPLLQIGGIRSARFYTGVDLLATGSGDYRCYGCYVVMHNMFKHGWGRSVGWLVAY